MIVSLTNTDHSGHNMTNDGTRTSRPHILVVGDVMIDRYILGETSRISPEAPIPIVAASREEMRAGGAANVAANVRALGPKSSLLTICGDDSAADDLVALMAEHGVDLHCVVDQGQRTTEKTRLISGGQHIARIDHDGAVSDAATAELARRFEVMLGTVDAVVFSDYGKGALSDLPTLLSIAAANHIPTYVDPKIMDKSRYKGAYLLKPNTREFHALFGDCHSDEMENLARTSLIELDLEYLVVTRGAKGIMLVSRSGETVNFPTEALEVYDVTGAGDTIIAALVAGVVQGLPMVTAIDHANVAAGIAVSRPGTYVVTREDLDDRLKRRETLPTKLASLSALTRKLADARKTGARVVFTNGCFDVLHAGHVRLLDLAKRQGDVLVVGLNSDSSITRLKGPSRPVNNVDDRAEVLSALSAVDHIILFDDETPLDLITAIKPNVLVKGGDYTEATIVGADVVRAHGGQVVIIPLLQGRSTTALLAALKR